MKKQSKEVKPSNIYFCTSCDNSKEMSHAEAMIHLKESHGLETKGLKAERKTLMHIDGDTWFSWRFQITIKSEKGDVVLINETVSPRAKNDMMRFA